MTAPAPVSDKRVDTCMHRSCCALYILLYFNVIDGSTPGRGFQQFGRPHEHPRWSPRADRARAAPIFDF